MTTPDTAVDPVSTSPPTRPTFGPIADQFTARTRTWIYLFTGMLAAAYAVIEANVNLHWGVTAAYAAWNFFASAVAVSNVPRTTGEAP